MFFPVQPMQYPLPRAPHMLRVDFGLLFLATEFCLNVLVYTAGRALLNHHIGAERSVTELTSIDSQRS